MSIIPAPYYTIRKINGEHFEVSRWGYYSTAPEETYTVLTWRKRCNCNSPYRPCKHYYMVEKLGHLADLHEWAIDSLGRPWNGVDL